MKAREVLQALNYEKFCNDWDSAALEIIRNENS